MAGSRRFDDEKRKTMEDMMLSEMSKELNDMFLKTSDWSFNPISLGFAMEKVFIHGLLDPLQDPKFYWLAQKVISRGEIYDVFMINKKEDKYLISKDHTTEHNDFLHKTKKNRLFTISSQEEARKILADYFDLEV